MLAQPYPQDGFIKIPVDAVCGQVRQADGSYKNPEKSLEDLQDDFFLRLMRLCDSKQNEAERLLLKHKNTVRQKERYRDKYERALAGEFSVEENTAIIQNHEVVRDALRAFADLIEHFRSAVDDWIVDGQLEKAERAIAEATSFGAATTLDDVKMLLANVEAEQ
ncbi:hypothetical protein AB835_11650 [Candidatus Endobugula sertula]|uniref:Uncharacterized protein n=1 Tax=Candidatus Endobugula sertula TaxID=62101 RepID=A0A1D2QMU4_9GAMM|nr:hypothetical protein AB835_11650 [Candidatus Endobugula sertula]